MDIRQWLQKTADREPPEKRIETGFPAFLQPQSEAANIRKPEDKLYPKRKRVSRDSSAPARRQSPCRFSSEHSRLAKNGAISISSRSSSSASSRSHQSTVSNRHAVPIETFQRRARHKTRPDRYESKPKRRKKEHNLNRDRKHESRRRKSHRNGDGARTTGLVQSFRLKNGPKNQRLTLKPDASAGIFKNGRASGPIATSGPGLPDLVFNEMKFLRRPKEHQDELPGEGPKKQSKKTQKQAHEEEISAYFNKRLPPEKKAGHPVPHAVGSQATDQRTLQRPVHAQAVLPPSQPPVELPDRPFLGFGSRGPLQDGTGSHRRSNSYYTWSESLPAKHSPAQAMQAVPALIQRRNGSPARPARQASQASTTSLRKARTESARLHRKHSPSDPGRGVQNRGSKRPARVEVFQAPKPTHHGTVSVIESSQPLPNAARLLSDIQLQDSNNRWEGSYHTSDILNIHNTTKEVGRSPSPVNQSHIGVNQKHEVHTTSTPSSERLRRTLRSLTRPEAEVASRPEPRPARQRREEDGDILLSDARMLRDQQVEHTTSSPARWEMPQRGFGRTSDLTRPQQRPLSRLPTARTPLSARQWEACSREGPRSWGSLRDVQGEGMLDVPPDATLIRPQRVYVSSNTREAEALVRRLASRDGVVEKDVADSLGIRSDRYEHLEQGRQVEVEELFGPTSLVSGSLSLRSDQAGGQLLGGHFQSEQYMDDVFHGDELVKGHQAMVNPDLTGFWRPNILY